MDIFVKESVESVELRIFHSCQLPSRDQFAMENDKLKR